MARQAGPKERALYIPAGFDTLPFLPTKFLVLTHVSGLCKFVVCSVCKLLEGNDLTHRTPLVRQ